MLISMSTSYKAALTPGFYDLTPARDGYQESTATASTGNRDAYARRYAESQAFILGIIAPHWADCNQHRPLSLHCSHIHHKKTALTDIPPPPSRQQSEHPPP